MSDTTPQDLSERTAILEQRARRLARIPEHTGQRSLASQVVLIEIEEQVFGLPAELTREVVDTPPITPLPGLPPALVGIAQARGEILAVVDLARLMGFEGPENPQCLAIVGGEDRSLGLLASRSNGFRAIYDDEMSDEMASDSGSAEELVQGITRDLVTVIDLQQLLASPAVIAHQIDKGASDDRPGQ